MSGARYVCCDEGRRRALKARPDLTGIDFAEVAAGATVALPSLITLVLVNPLPPVQASITTANIRITGGVRFAPPRPQAVANQLDGNGNVSAWVVTIAGGQPTDFSDYQLEIVTGPDQAQPPPFMDPRLATVTINFKINCPSDSDCQPDCGNADPDWPAPDFDYRARDWPGLRQLLLDRLAGLIPGFAGDEEMPADLTTTLVEALALEGDRLSYRLDWIGTEAFIGTARSRTSIARHARLVSYRPGEGASARTFIRADFVAGLGLAADGMLLPAATPLLLTHADLPAVVPASRWPLLLAGAPLAFETITDQALWAWQSHIAFHNWSDGECRLPAGATAATLVDGSGGNGMLAAGDLLLLAELRSPITGQAADARPNHRQVVRLTAVTPVIDPLAPPGTVLIDVAWDQADALGFDLVLAPSADVAALAGPGAIWAEAAGNILLADHGVSLPPASALGLPTADMAALAPRLDPPAPIAGERWRPVLSRADLARAMPAARPGTAAAGLCATDAAQALPELRLIDVFANWTARADLLESGPFSRDFVVEAGHEGRATLRFGDGLAGLAPEPGGLFAVSGRFGSGNAGNIGSDALGHAVVSDALAAGLAAGRLRISNPLPASGGAAPELTASVRRNAPHAYRRQQRAVTSADWIEVACRHPEVSAALAVPRWTGAFQTMLVYVDRVGGLPVTAAFRAEIAAHLDRYRPMAMDVAVRGAVPVPLDIGLFICAQPGRLASEVGRRVRAALRPVGNGGQPGFFHPDRFSFGAALQFSALVAAVMAVEGVQSVEITRFQRFGRLPAGELAAGAIVPRGAEVLELADDPSLPERGRLAISMGGGR